MVVFLKKVLTFSKENHSGSLRVFDKKDFRWVFGQNKEVVRFPVACHLICMNRLVLKELVHLRVYFFYFKLEVKTKTRKEEFPTKPHPTCCYW